MPGKYQYDIELKSNVAKLLTDMKEVQDRLDTVEGKEYKIKLNVDEKKLSNVISNLEKMLDSLGKGTGDFKQFENLSKELSSIVSEVQNLSKAFGKVDDSGTKTLLSSIQNIDKSLSELSQHIINVNKNMSNIGGDTNSAVKQAENISNAYDNAAKSAEKLADAQSKIGNKSNISSGTQIKDVFQGDDKVNTDASTTAIKEESQALEKVSASAKDAATSKEKFANANKEVKASADSSKTSISEEEKYFNSLGSAIEKYDSTLTSISRKPADGKRSNELQEKIDIISASLDELKTLGNKASKEGYVFNEKDVERGKDLEDIIKNNIELVKQMSAAQKGSDEDSRTKEIDKLTKYLDKNTRISKEAREQLEGYLALLKSGDPSVNVKEIHTAWTKVAVAEREAGREGKSFLDIFKNKVVYNYAAQLAGYFLSFMDIIRYAREGIDTIKEFEDGLTKISYTMDMTKSQLNDLGASILDTAKDIDSSIDNAMQVSQIYANMNTSAEEIKKLSEPTLILSNLTGFDASTVADDIQAVTQQFEIAAEESMHIADVYDKISRNISVDYSKGIESIAEAVQVAGSTSKQAGLSFEQLAAIVGKTAEKTRLEGSQIGNGLKTIMTRLSKVSELSDEVDPETLSDASESLHKIGIEVYNADGSFRKFDVIMGELANKWDTLSDAEKSNISFSIAATRQTNLLSSILSNFSDSMSMAEEATHANGNALENNQKWVDSFGGHLQSLENTAKSAWINILDSDTIKGGADVLNSLLKVVVGLVDTFGLLPTAAGIGGIVAGIKNVGQAKMWACLIYAYPC